jgi:hypothetical protein
VKVDALEAIVPGRTRGLKAILASLLVMAIITACSASGVADYSIEPSFEPTPSPSVEPTPPLTGVLSIALPGERNCADGVPLEVPKDFPSPSALTTATLGEGLTPGKATVTLFENDLETGSYPIDAIPLVPLRETLNLRVVLMYEGTQLAEVKCGKVVSFVEPSIRITSSCDPYSARGTVGVPFTALVLNVAEPGWTVVAEINGKRVGTPAEVKELPIEYTSPAIQVSLGSKTLSAGSRKVVWKLINPKGKVIQTKTCKSVITQEKYADVSLASSGASVCLSYSANFRVWVTLKVKNTGNIASDIIYIRVQSVEGSSIPNWIRGQNVSTAEDHGGGLWAEVIVKGERVSAKSSKTFKFAIDFYYNPDVVNVNVFNGKPNYDLYVSGQFADESFQAPSYFSRFC